MLYLLSFAIGGFARSIGQFALLAAILLALYAALMLLVSVPALQAGSTSLSRVLEDLPVQALVVPAIMALGALCRRLIVGTRPPPADTEEVRKTFD